MKNKKTKIILICLILLIIGLVGYEWYRINIIGSAFDKGNIKISVYDSSSKSSFYAYNDKLFYCTKDSMQLLDENGGIIWTDTYNMKNPYMLSNKNIVGISEKEGKNVRVYNEKGRLYETENGTVMFFDINSDGEAAVINKNENNYKIFVYESDGTKMFEINKASSDGIPVSAALSDDGNILALNYVTYDDIKLSSNVMFYYLGSGAGNASDINENGNIISAFSMEDEFCGFISFLNNNSLAAITDKQIKCVSITPEEGCRDKWNTELKNEISNIEITNEGNIVLAFGKPLMNKNNAYEENSVVWLSGEGASFNKYVSEKEIDRLSSGFGSVIVGSGRTFKSIKDSGGIEWEYNALQDISDIKYFKKTDKILLVTGKEAVIINPKSGYTPAKTTESQKESSEKPSAVSEQTTEGTVSDNNTNTENTINEAPIQPYEEEPLYEQPQESPAEETTQEEITEASQEEPPAESETAPPEEETVYEAPPAENDNMENIEADGPVMEE